MNPSSTEEYIAAFPEAVQTILLALRETIRKAAPEATEKISYRMPAFVLHGDLVYFAAFKAHIGLYPPVRDAQLRLEATRFAGPKGNLRFLLQEPLPHDLIFRIVQARVQENAAKHAQKQVRKKDQSVSPTGE